MLLSFAGIYLLSKFITSSSGIDFSMSSQDGKVDCGFTFNQEDYHIYESSLPAFAHLVSRLSKHLT